MPFQLPLDRTQFRVALCKGLGRTRMHLARFGVGGLEDLLVEACTSAVSYDPQMEGPHVTWLMELVDAASIEDRIATHVTEALRVDFEKKAHWDKVQVCDMALALAERGWNEARRGLYSTIHKDPHSSQFYGVYEIIELDGGDGLLSVADRIGQWVLDDPEMCVFFDIIDHYDELHGKGAGKRLLAHAAQGNHRIAALLEYLREFDVDDDEPDPPIAPDAIDDASQPDRRVISRFEEMRHWTAEELTRDVQATDPAENPRRRLYMRWGDDASDEQLGQVFKALCKEPDQARVRLLISVFQRRGFREVNARALQFAESDDLQVRWSTYGCLAPHRHEEVRALAMRRIQAGRMVEGELALLVKNYEAGDWPTIRDSLPHPDDASDLHRMLQDLLNIYEENRLPESVEPLTVVYEHTPCSLCREGAVKALIQLGALPDWIRAECRFDANEETRIAALAVGGV